MTPHQYISIDEQKKLLAGYSPENAEKFHKESAKMADKSFEKSLKENKTKNAILLCGGSASGKTEFYYDHLNNTNALIYDSTLPTVEGARIKLRKISLRHSRGSEDQKTLKFRSDKIQKANKKSSVFAIIPDNLQRAFVAFLNRNRRFSDEHFYRTHSGSRKTLLWLATSRPDIELKIFESFYDGKEKLRYRPFEFDSSKELVEFLWSIQYTEEELIAKLALTLSSHNAQG